MAVAFTGKGASLHHRVCSAGLSRHIRTAPGAPPALRVGAAQGSPWPVPPLLSQAPPTLAPLMDTLVARQPLSLEKGIKPRIQQQSQRSPESG